MKESSRGGQNPELDRFLRKLCDQMRVIAIETVARSDPRSTIEPDDLINAALVSAIAFVDARRAGRAITPEYLNEIEREAGFVARRGLLAEYRREAGHVLNYPHRLPTPMGSPGDGGKNMHKAPSPGQRRAAYEAAVRALQAEADLLLASGLSEEEVARLIVQRRNDLKREARQTDDPKVVQLMERRNQQKYGDPIGPDCDQLYRKYRSWRGVIDAACRPADLSGME